MAVPVHLFLKDDGGAMIRGGSDVADREGSIELRELIHNLSIPTDDDTRDCPGTGHMENVSLRYAKITWKILDGNIQYTDAWNERPAA
ncbi:TPA: hypothetical protein QCJ51_000606 [Enterobacter roggenkampii]|nr:hypothetical protein [Enterobacter roggenkampii]